MHLLKKVLFHRVCFIQQTISKAGLNNCFIQERRSVSPKPTSSRASTQCEDADEKADDDQKDDGTIRFVDLPSEIQMAILKCLSYDDIAKLRRVSDRRFKFST
ncbi:hypothetical protein Y032_0134g1865 [Ancylostoma ceylanicum]|uniref:F-box domain-containing protein n=1 Tax=Ancylostoma ceylanicum TaxID=53326 RepID=A0A016T672_9BILA|nr:hypothetical protein Y032_0134g1865 [Ancylostoma ceylanicum]